MQISVCNYIFLRWFFIGNFPKLFQDRSLVALLGQEQSPLFQLHKSLKYANLGTWPPFQGISESPASGGERAGEQGFLGRGAGHGARVGADRACWSGCRWAGWMQVVGAGDVQKWVLGGAGELRVPEGPVEGFCAPPVAW